MTTLLKRKYVFLYFDESFIAEDITVEEFILLLEDYENWIKKILEKHNEMMPLLNARQLNEFLRIITENDTLLPAKKTKNKDSDILKDFHVVEGIMMRNLKQPLSEMRQWKLSYFFKLYTDLDVIIDPSKYNDKKNASIPDKAKFKKEFNHLYK